MGDKHIMQSSIPQICTDFHDCENRTCTRELLLACSMTINTYRTAVSPTLDLLCHEDFSVGRSETESNIEIFMAQ